MGKLVLKSKHRLLCGDATLAPDAARLFDGQRVAIVFTSPPYANQREYTADSDLSDWDALMRGVFGTLPSLTEDNAQVLVNLGLVHTGGEWDPYWENWIAWMRAEGWKRFAWYVWDQGPGMPGNWGGRLAPSFEFVFHFNRKSVQPVKARDCKYAGNVIKGGGMRNADGTVGERHGKGPIQATAILDSVIRVNRQGAPHGNHPAPFPPALAEYVLRSWPGDVYDPFCGAGSTLVAAEKQQRRCYAMEIAPAYCDVIVKRFETLTGEKAVRVGQTGS